MKLILFYAKIILLISKHLEQKKIHITLKNNTAIIHLTAHVKRKLPGMPK